MPVKHQRGFNLISIVLSIILMSFALLTITTSLVPKSQQNVELIYSTKAAELGAAVMDEILGRQFDQNSGPNGGLPECDSPTGERCTLPGELKPEAGETDRTLFNDVDDFNELSGNVQDVLGDNLGSVYPNFSISISVFYDANLDGIADTVRGNRKCIVVDVIDPSGQHYPFSVYRANF